MFNLKKTKKPRKQLFPKYVYIDLFDEDPDNEDNNTLWSELKRYRFQKCLW